MRKVSDLLREAREEKKLTIEAIAKVLKIKKGYLEAIEKGEFISLPSESYAQGFVKNYAKFLGVQASQAIPLFRREYKSKHIFNIVPHFRKTEAIFHRKFFLNAKTILGLLAVIIVLLYIFFQYNSLIFAPKLDIISPSSSVGISGNVVEISGKTDPYATVNIEGDETYVGLDGHFRKSIYMFSGENKITIIAKNRFGKETKKVINVRVN